MCKDEKKRTILLAEDDEVSRKIVVKYLSQNGYCIITANSGREAVEVFKKQRIDMILLDVRMPEMDGFTAVRLIRKHEIEIGSRVPIIAVTACAIKGDREKCLEAGMDDYISKPIDLKKLLEVIRSWLK